MRILQNSGVVGLIDEKLQPVKEDIAVLQNDLNLIKRQNVAIMQKLEIEMN